MLIWVFAVHVFEFLKGPGKRLFPHSDKDEVAIRPHDDGQRPSKRQFRARKGSDQVTVPKTLDGWASPEHFLPAGGDQTLDRRLVLCKPRDDAVEEARQISKLPGAEDGVIHLVFYVDASIGQVQDTRVSSPGAYAVVYKSEQEGGDEWVVQSWFVEKMFSIQWGETMAIAEAVNMATLRLRLTRGQRANTDVYVFSDSVSSLDFLIGVEGPRKTHYGAGMNALRRFITRSSSELTALGAKLAIRFIPGHEHDIQGHVLADKAARSTYIEGVERLENTNSRLPIPAPVLRISNSDAPKSLINGSHIKHCAIWSVLHHQSVRGIATFQRNKRKSTGMTHAEEQGGLRQLRNLLRLPKETDKSGRRVREIRALLNEVGDLLSASETEKARQICKK